MFGKHKKTVGFAVFVFIVIVVAATIVAFWPQSRVSEIDDAFKEVNGTIQAAGFDRIRTVYAVDINTLYVYDIYNENVTHVLDVPGKATVSVRDMVVVGT